ncbi:MAG: hypothetical protein LAO06_01970 [Acidobacteriia bacterium]|nr:hypothetical protein [Terriglobia bacterium]
MEEIHATWLPEHPEFDIRRDKDADARLRSAILQRAGKHGAKFSREAKICRGADNVWLPHVRRGWIFATAAAVVLAFVAGAAMRQRRPRLFGPTQAVAVPMRAISPSSAKPPTADSPPQVGGQLEAALVIKVEEAQREQLHLRRQLEAEKARAAALAWSAADSARVTNELMQKLEVSRASEADSLAELARLKSLQATTDGINIAQQQEIRRLNDRLADQIASVDRERQLLSAHREIRDLIAARNLHIVDVYDTDGRGHTSRAFGRVFYTEGRSLVFYAYDLNDRHGQTGKYVFSVWGKRDAMPHDVKSLGALSKDSQAQARWVLTITDPKVLGAIDSVFVTVERGDKPSKRPSGRPLLSAFLGSPANHP